MKPIIEYRRVSEYTPIAIAESLLKQQVVNRIFAGQHGFEIVEVIEETASGNLGMYHREGLMLALEKARKLQCPVLVSNIDRISRDASYVSEVFRRGVEIVTCEPISEFEKTLLGVTG